MSPELKDWQRPSWSSGEFVGPLKRWHLDEMESTWRLILGSDHHQGLPFELDDAPEADVRTDLFDLAWHLAIPLTNNGDGRTYDYVHAADYTGLIIEAFERRGWRRPNA